MDGHFEIEILEDGKLKVTSPGSFSPAIHKNADEFLTLLKEMCGGECVTEKLKEGEHHHHRHGHGHSHGEHEHHHRH